MRYWSRIPYGRSNKRGSGVSEQESLSRTVRAVLGVRGESQRTLATAIGMDRATLANRLTNRVPWRVDDVGALAAHFGCQPEDLMRGPGHALDVIERVGA